jgi:choline dehydrogenase-like flavoprotein
LFSEREIILAAGAYGSPHILMLSGIGSADELAPLGIPVVVDLPVGTNQTSVADELPLTRDRPGAAV